MSIKKAMKTYARQGGLSSIFVHDDGLQLIPESNREERIRFYADHGIGWVAHPKHDGSEGGFKRGGWVKKGGHVNYCLFLTLEKEGIIQELQVQTRGKSPF